MGFSVPYSSLVCGPPGRFFDVMCCVSLVTEGDGNSFVGKSTRVSEMKDVRFSMSLGGKENSEKLRK